ncbi:hypothetical protein V8E53_007081 [Lactarius tabidus]
MYAGAGPRSRGGTPVSWSYSAAPGIVVESLKSIRNGAPPLSVPKRECQGKDERHTDRRSWPWELDLDLVAIGVALNVNVGNSSRRLKRIGPSAGAQATRDKRFERDRRLRGEEGAHGGTRRSTTTYYHDNQRLWSRCSRSSILGTVWRGQCQVPQSLNYSLEGDDHELRAHHRHPPDDTSRRRQLGEQFRCQDFGHSCPSVLESRVSVQKRARSEEEDLLERTVSPSLSKQDRRRPGRSRTTRRLGLLLDYRTTERGKRWLPVQLPSRIINDANSPGCSSWVIIRVVETIDVGFLSRVYIGN